MDKQISKKSKSQPEVKHCQFLESDRHKSDSPPDRCAIGVNYYSVGRNRELCHMCPMLEIGDAPLCEHLDIFAFLQRGRKGFIELEMVCALSGTELPDLEGCWSCPERTPANG